MHNSSTAQGSKVDHEVEQAARIDRHADAFARKPALRQLFQDIHAILRAQDDRWLSGSGTRIELGAGVAPMRDTYPDVRATDIVSAPHLDGVADAQNLDVPAGSVRTLYLQNCFHHLPDPEAFFHSSERALAAGGGIVMLEPHWGPIASMIFPRLFKDEGFDKKQVEWTTPTDGPMRAANQALSYIVLKRDRVRYEKLFPKMKVTASGVMPNYMRYVLTGGLNFPQLLPTLMYPVVKGVETVFSPAAPLIGLHQWFVIRKDV